MNEFLNKNKMLIVGLVVAVAAIMIISVMGGGNGTSTVSDNARLDQSKKVKSNVGDTTIGGDNTQLEGINVGGNFNLDQSKKNTVDSSKK